MTICSDNFIKQTAIDYCLDECRVKSVFNKSSNIVEFYEKLELEIKPRNEQ